MAAKWAVGSSVYSQKPLWAIIADDDGGYAVIKADGTRNDDQERRIARLYDMARKKPEDAEGIIRLASINQSAVAIAVPSEASSADEARTQALAALG